MVWWSGALKKHLKLLREYNTSGGFIIITISRIIPKVWSVLQSHTLEVSNQSNKSKKDLVERVTFFFFALQLTGSFLIPTQETEPVPSALEAWSLNHWTTRVVLLATFLIVSTGECYWCLVFEGEDAIKHPVITGYPSTTKNSSPQIRVENVNRLRNTCLDREK